LNWIKEHKAFRKFGSSTKLAIMLISCLRCTTFASNKGNLEIAENNFFAQISVARNFKNTPISAKNDNFTQIKGQKIA